MLPRTDARKRRDHELGLQRRSRPRAPSNVRLEYGIWVRSYPVNGLFFCIGAHIFVTAPRVNSIGPIMHGHKETRQKETNSWLPLTRITVGAQRTLLENMLDYNRAALVEAVQGLTEEGARRRLVASATTPIGLIKHAAAAERIWFQHYLAGIPEAECDGYATRGAGSRARTLLNSCAASASWRATSEGCCSAYPSCTTRSSRPDGWQSFWLWQEYFPAAARASAASELPTEQVEEIIGADRVDTVLVPHDCSDGFGPAYWRRPDAYLRPEVRARISGLTRLCAKDLAPGLERLRHDLDTGAWHARHRDLLDLNAIDAGLRLIVRDQQR